MSPFWHTTDDESMTNSFWPIQNALIHFSRHFVLFKMHGQFKIHNNITVLLRPSVRKHGAQLCMKKRIGLYYQKCKAFTQDGSIHLMCR